MDSSVLHSPRKPLHIAFLIPNLYGGGAEQVFLNIVQGMLDWGHKVDIILLNTTVHYPQEVPDKAILFIVDDIHDQQTAENTLYPSLRKRFLQLTKNSRCGDRVRLANVLKWNPLTLPNVSMFRQAYAIANYMEQQKPDIVFPHLSKAKVATLLATHLTESPPVVPVIHNVMETRRKRDHLRYRLLFPKAAQLVAVSKGVAKNVGAVIGIPDDKITTIYNPIILSDIEKLKIRKPDHPWFTDDGPPIVLACGRLAKIKDFPTLLRAFSRLSQRRQCRLVILGEGRERKRLERLVEEMGLQQKVSLPGWVANPYAYMSRAAIFVLSSRHEGLAMVLIEALACGCPCASTDCPSGPSEILEEGQIGALVSVGDDVALASAIQRIIDNPPEKQMLLDRAAFFSSERALGMYEELAMEVIDKQHSQADIGKDG